MWSVAVAEDMKKEMKMEMTVENFQKHMHQLSTMFRIALLYDPKLRRHESVAFTFRVGYVERMFGLTGRAVHTRPIDDETSYVVAMHEFGHHLAPNGFSYATPPKPGCHQREWFSYYAAKLVCEEAAWDWARYYVEQVFDWTAAMEQTKQYAFGTYQQARRYGR